MIFHQNFNKLYVLLAALVIFHHIKGQEAELPTLNYYVSNVKHSTLGTKYSHQQILNEFPIHQMDSIKAKEEKMSHHRYLVPFIIGSVKELTRFNNFVELRKKEGSSKGNPILIIGLNTFENNIEYQLIFSYPALNFSKERNFFLNPDAVDYKDKMITELQLLFNNKEIIKNVPPEAVIHIDGRKNFHRKYHRSNNDTIVLDGFSSFDDITPQKHLHYKWSVTYNGKSNNGFQFIKGFDFEEGEQRILIEKEGEYIFTLKVYDGICWSEQTCATIEISVHQQPKITITNNNINICRQNTLVSFLYKKSFIFDFHHRQTNIEFNIANFKSNDTLRIDYISSIDQYGDFFLKDNDSEANIINSYYNNENKPIIYLPSIKTKDGIDRFLFNTDKLHLKSNYLSGKLEINDSGKIPNGGHMFEMYVIRNNIKSPIDTILFTKSHKSIFSLYSGFDRLNIYYNNQYEEGFNLSAFSFGIRTYLLPRIYADFGIIVPERKQTFSDQTLKFTGFQALEYRLGYDLIPIQSKYQYKTRFTASINVGYNMMHVVDEERKDIHLFGFGIYPRIQLLRSYPNIGILFIQFGLAAYSDSIDLKSYNTERISISLLYGFLDL